MNRVILRNTVCAIAAIVSLSASPHELFCEDAAGEGWSGIEHSVSSEYKDGAEVVHVTMVNRRAVPFQPVRAGIRLGIDTYMDHYPEWNDKYFPTLLMCEPEHFYGYMQTPSGRVKSIVSPDPVASWTLDYNLGYQDPAPHWFMGHRIKGADLDLLAAPPLPGRHPQNLWQLLPGEKREWTIYIRDLADPDDFERTVAAAKTPAIAMERTSFAPGEEISFIVYGEHPRCLLGDSPIPLKRVGVGEWLASARNIPSGIHEVSLSDRGKSAHGYVNVRFPWRSTMELARMGAERYKQKATSHVESWYGFHTAFLAARHFPDSAIDSRLNRRFDLVFNNLYAPDGSPRNYAWRIQNTASTVGILVDRFEAYGDTADLRRAEQLADWMIGFSQKESGAFMNGNTVYSSVIYPAKSLLELADAEAAAGRSEAAARYWEAQYDVHLLPNMISSPHGWSAWRGYASYYAYLLTGREEFLTEVFDLASSLASLIDHTAGKLRWAFVVDPKISGRQISEPNPEVTADQPSFGTPPPDMYPHSDYILGETYVDMISDWQTMVSSDNDVHEAFKFIAEAVLKNAFVAVQPDGSLHCYNCTAVRSGRSLKVRPSEPQIDRLYISGEAPSGLKVSFPGETTFIASWK